jgi:hypothetical protein
MSQRSFQDSNEWRTIIYIKITLLNENYKSLIFILFLHIVDYM